MMHSPEFIPGFLAGDRKVLETLYTKVFPKVSNYIRANNGSTKDAEDIFQSALLVLFVKIKEDGLRVQSFENYLFTICRNLWRREAAKNRVTKLEQVTLWSKELDLGAFYLEQQQFELYREKFDLLSDQCKELLSMSFAKVAYQKIVEAFKYASELVARQRVFKCKKRLIDLIKNDSRFNQLKQ